MEGVSHTATRMVGYYSDVFMRVINTAQVIEIPLPYTDNYATCLTDLNFAIFNVWNHFVWLWITDEGSLPRIAKMVHIVNKIRFEMVHICIHLSRSLFFIFQLRHVAKFYGRLRLIRSVWEHQNFPC